MKLIHCALVILMISESASQDKTTLKPPVAKKVPKTDVIHGESRTDDYFWMREKSHPDVKSYLEAENAYTEGIMKPASGLQETIYQEILKRTKQTDLTVPYRIGSHWYYTRTEEGKQYPVYCRKKGSLEGNEEVVLDLNELAMGHSFLGLGAYTVSEDGSLLAYSLDTTGFRQYQLSFKDLTTGRVLPDSIGQVNSVVWAADNKTLFYVKEDHAKRPYQLYRHRLGEDARKDERLFEEKDELYRIWTYKTSDKKYIVFMSASSITNEARLLPSNLPGGAFRMFLAREEGHEYDLDHREGLLYIRSNKGAKNFRILTTTVDRPGVGDWKEFVPHRADVKIEGIDLFKNHAVITQREQGLIQLKVHDFRTGKSDGIRFPEPVYSASPGANPEFDTDVFRYNYQSFITPNSVFDFDMNTKAGTLLKQTEVLGGYDPTAYVSERIWAKASDGTLVPISLVHKKGLVKNGKNPLLLYGYGSYGVSIPVGFSIPRLSLLDRGVVFALAHIRGGGDLGEQWREDGKMLRKKNTFMDFVACAEHLLREGYTSTEKLVIQGGSAGGLLIGAVLNMRPDLFKAAHMAVPFVDVVNTMMDETLPLTVGEFLEWGNPKKKAEYEYMKSYCPYSNLRTASYPAILVTTSFNDSQVMYWEPAKYVSKLRTMKTDSNALLLKTNLGAGHGGASGRYDAFKEQSFIFAFLLAQLGIVQ
ncbi:MAG: S9 family peptidase [Bacteroidota bacterium]